MRWPVSSINPKFTLKSRHAICVQTFDRHCAAFFRQGRAIIPMIFNFNFNLQMLDNQFQEYRFWIGQIYCLNSKAEYMKNLKIYLVDSVWSTVGNRPLSDFVRALLLKQFFLSVPAAFCPPDFPTLVWSTMQMWQYN